MSPLHQGSSFRVSHKPVPRPLPRFWSVRGRCEDRTELCPFASDGKGWGVFVCLTIQTFSMVLFLSTVIIKLVSDGLVQFSTPRLGDGAQQGFSRQEMWYVAQMNASLVSQASEGAP